MAEGDKLSQTEPTDGSTADSFLRKVARTSRLGTLPHVGALVGGKYRIERLLGAGAMGAVFAAHHELLQQSVALKVMLPQIAASPEAAERFLNEARAASRIEGEHVVRVLDVGHLENDVPFIALELLEGADLAQVLAERGKFPMGEALDYVLQALDAVAQAHALGVVHRDLKPSNLFLAQRRDGTQIVKVLDFGISKAVSPQTGTSPNVVTQSSSMLGSPLYMSPEQVRSSKAVDARADIWAFGVIIFELLAGRPPFTAQTVNQVLVQILEQEPLRLRALSPELPGELEAVILRCLAKQAAERFADVAQLAEALGPFSPPHARLLIERIRRVTANSPRSSSYPPVEVSELADTEVDTGASPARSRLGLARRFRRAGWVLFAALASAAVASAGFAVAKRRPEPPAPRAGSSAPSGLAPLRPSASQAPPVGPDALVSPPSVTSALAAPSASAQAKRLLRKARPAPTRDPFDTPR